MMRLPERMKMGKGSRRKRGTCRQRRCLSRLRLGLLVGGVKGTELENGRKRRIGETSPLRRAITMDRSIGAIINDDKETRRIDGEMMTDDSHSTISVIILM
jgi:hypothetical protein